MCCDDSVVAGGGPFWAWRFATRSGALQAQTRMDTWTTDNGLPQNSVTGLTQTPDGLHLADHSGGRVRFDGLRFTVSNPSNTPAITNNRMCGALAASWVASKTEHYSHPFEQSATHLHGWACFTP